MFEEMSASMSRNMLESREIKVLRDVDESSFGNEHKLKYNISKEEWQSKMLVDFEVDGETKHAEVEGSGISISIPNNATNIKVGFQAKRYDGIWFNVREYDILNDRWIKPYQAHTFEYDTPVSRTYKLTGKVYWERALDVTKEIFGIDKITEVFDRSHRTEPKYSSQASKFQPHTSLFDRPVKRRSNLIRNSRGKRVLDTMKEERKAISFHTTTKLVNRAKPKIHPRIWRFNSEGLSSYKMPVDHVMIPNNATNNEVIFQDTPSDQVLKYSGESTISSVIQNSDTQESVQIDLGETAGSSLPVTVPRTDWFAQNILDENLNLKDEYEKELSRLSWVRDFYIGFDGKKDKTWKIFITHAKDEEPSMKELSEIFGEKQIASFVDFIPEQIQEVTGKSRFLRGPKTGDGIHEENGNSDGTIGIICVGDPRTRSHYAITSYHVCYKEKLPEDLFEAHRDLKEDYDNRSPKCRDVTYKYTDGDERGTLGTFYCGLYNDEHDIALVKLEYYLSCQHHITFLNRREIERTLASKKEVMQKMGEMLGSVPVKIFGSITENREGILFAINGKTTNGGMNKGFYRIRGADGENFAEEGDSGALVYMICDGHKNIPFAYVSNVNEKGEYYCGNLKFSLEKLNKVMKACLGQCGFK